MGEAEQAVWRMRVANVQMYGSLAVVRKAAGASLPWWTMQTAGRRRRGSALKLRPRRMLKDRKRRIFLPL